MTSEEARKVLATMAPSAALLSFFNALDHAGAIGDTERFFEKPWKWADEYAAWVNAGEPMEESDAGWPEFVKGINW